MSLGLLVVTYGMYTSSSNAAPEDMEYEDTQTMAYEDGTLMEFEG